MPERAAVSTVLAFDFGLRRIGVAVGQGVTSSASPIGIVINRDSTLEEIGLLVDEWQPERLVVGLPLNADGSESDMTRSARRFAESLEAFGRPVDTVDERYSSLEAEQHLRTARQAGRRRRVRKADIDALAAVLIAERYLSGGD